MKIPPASTQVYMHTSEVHVYVHGGIQLLDWNGGIKICE